VAEPSSLNKPDDLAVIPAKAGIQEAFEIPGFRVALAIASLPGMTMNCMTNIGYKN
jgi:hypothetical protein